MKDPKFIAIVLIMFSFVMPMFIYTVAGRYLAERAWEQEIINRIDTELQTTGILFNRTRPTENEYSLHVKKLDCCDEDDWQSLKTDMKQIFEFMKSDKFPRESNAYAYEKWGWAYIGYTLDSPIGRLWVGYEIHINLDDC